MTTRDITAAAAPAMLTAATAFCARASQQAATFALALLAAHALAPAEYGVYTVALVFVTFVHALGYTGTFHYLVTQKGDDRAVRDSTFWLMLGLSAVGSAAVALLAAPAATAFGSPDLLWVLLVLAAVQPAAAVTAWCSAALMRERKMRANNVVMLAQNVAAFAIGAGLMLTLKSVVALVAFRVARIAIGVVLYLPLARPGLHVRRSIVRDAARYSRTMYGAKTLEFCGQYGADLALGLAFSTAEAGLYRFGNRIASASADLVGGPLRQFALAGFGAANRRDASFAPVAATFLSTMVIAYGLVALPLAVFAAPLMAALFQPAYAPAAAVAGALALRHVFSAGAALAEPALAARGRTGAVLALFAALALAQLVAALLAAPFGLAAVAAAQAAAAALGSAFALRQVAAACAVPLAALLPRLVGAAVLLIAFAAVLLAVRMAVPELIAALALGGVAAVATLGVALALRLVDLAAFGD